MVDRRHNNRHSDADEGRSQHDQRRHGRQPVKSLAPRKSRQLHRDADDASTHHGGRIDKPTAARSSALHENIPPKTGADDKSLTKLPPSKKPDWALDPNVVMAVQGQMALYISANRKDFPDITNQALANFVNGRFSPVMEKVFKAMPDQATAWEQFGKTLTGPTMQPSDKDDFRQKMIDMPGGGKALFVAVLDEKGRRITNLSEQLAWKMLDQHGLFLGDDVKVDRSQLRELLQAKPHEDSKLQKLKNHVRGLYAQVIENEMKGAPSFFDREKIGEEIANQMAWSFKNKPPKNDIEALHRMEHWLQTDAKNGGFWQNAAHGENHQEINRRAVEVALQGMHLIGPSDDNGSGGVKLSGGPVLSTATDGAGSTESIGVAGFHWKALVGNKKFRLATVSYEQPVQVASAGKDTVVASLNSNAAPITSAEIKPPSPAVPEKSAPASLPAPTAVVPIQPTVAGLKTQYGPTPTSGVKANAEPVVVKSIMDTSGATVDPPEPSQRNSRGSMASFRIDFPALTTTTSKVVVAGGSDIEAAFDNWSKARRWLPTLNSTQ